MVSPQPQLVLSCLAVFWLAMLFSVSSGVPTYTITDFRPGAMLMAYSTSSACSLSSHLPVQLGFTLSVATVVRVVFSVWPTWVK